MLSQTTICTLACVNLCWRVLSYVLIITQFSCHRPPFLFYVLITTMDVDKFFCKEFATEQCIHKIEIVYGSTRLKHVTDEKACNVTYI